MQQIFYVSYCIVFLYYIRKGVDVCCLIVAVQGFLRTPDRSNEKTTVSALLFYKSQCGFLLFSVTFKK